MSTRRRRMDKELPALPSPYEIDHDDDYTSVTADYASELCDSPASERDNPLSRQSTLSATRAGRRQTLFEHDTSRENDITRRGSIMSFHPAPPDRHIPTRQPTMLRQLSSYSYHRSSSAKPTSRVSVDSQNESLLPTTNRFTQRWVIPGLNTVSKYKRRRRFTIDDDDGLGMNDVREWPKMKWSLLFSILTVLTYGSFATYVCLATWFRTWMHADVMYVVDYDILVLISFCGCILLFTSIIGITGLILNSRPILAVYALLLWPALMSMLAIGYTSYKRHAYALDHKLSFFWSQYFTPLGRLLIQNSLHCCGFYSPLHDAVPSRRCFPRTGLPGCKSKLWRFERVQLATVWQTTFALVAVHLMNIVVSLLCANHVTETFGKGVMPRQYRLTKADVRQLEMQMRRPEYSRASSSLTFREDKR